MIRRKYRERLRHLFGLVALALLINLTLPNTNPVHAQVVSPDTSNSNAVITDTPPVATTETSTPPSLPTIPDKPFVVHSTMTVRASAYTSTVAECDSDPFTTASGAKVKDGIIAMNGIPFGTKIRIRGQGDKIYVVQDRMNAKWGNHRIDIWMPDRHQALEWGVRTVTIDIVSQ